MFWTNFSAICQAKGVSPSSVAAAVGLSSGCVSRWKTAGAVPRHATIKKVADYLGVPVEDLTTDNYQTATAEGMSFYEKYLALCEENNEKPTPVALKLGFSSGAVSQWRKGSTPRQAGLNAIAEHFGVPVSYFTGVDNNKRAAYSAAFMDIISSLDPDAQRQLEEYALYLYQKQEKGR